MKYAPLAALALFASATATLADETRSAEKHKHGHGAFQMVIEDHRIVIELEVPAHDIVGFEHAPSTAQQRSALAEAAAALGRPDVLFGIPEAAECAIGQVEIGFGATGGHRHEHGGEDAHEDDDHDHDDHAAEGHDHDHGHEGDAAHSEVTAYYSLACAHPEVLDRLGFAYFEAFAGAEELEVVVLSPSGQSAGEVSRNETVFEIE